MWRKQKDHANPNDEIPDDQRFDSDPYISTVNEVIPEKESYNPDDIDEDAAVFIMRQYHGIKESNSD